MTSTFSPLVLIMNNAMKNKKVLLSLVMMAPLLMANSPAPYPSYDEYSNLEVQVQRLAEFPDYTYRFQLDIKNTGDTYAFAQYGYIRCNKDLDNTYQFEAYRQSIFNNEVIAPGKTQVFFTETWTQIDKIEGPLTWYLTTFSIPDLDVSFSNFTFKKVEENQYKISYKTTGLGDYYYSYIVDVVYQEKEYSFILSDYDPYVSTAEELDLEALNVTGMHAFRSSYKIYRGGGGYTPARKDTAPVVVAVASGLVLVLTIGITIPCVVVYKKRRKQ